MAEKPVILLAFANDQDGNRYLRDLPWERRELEKLLQAVEDKGKDEIPFEWKIIPNATVEEIVDNFQRYEHRVSIFHFGGHAGQPGLILESSGRGSQTAHAGGLADLLREHGAPYLVFLNGCGTWSQVRGLHNAGVRAVIATARAIGDELAASWPKSSTAASPRAIAWIRPSDKPSPWCVSPTAMILEPTSILR